MSAKTVLHFTTMKYKITLILLATAMLAYSGIIGLLSQRTENWKFIQSVGGIKVSEKENVLYVECYAGGGIKVTVKPTMINSALKVHRIKHKRAGNAIQIRVVTGLVAAKTKDNPKQLDLSAYPAGEYSVQYKDPDGTIYPLGQIELSAKEKSK